MSYHYKSIFLSESRKARRGREGCLHKLESLWDKEGCCFVRITEGAEDTEEHRGKRFLEGVYGYACGQMDAWTPFTPMGLRFEKHYVCWTPFASPRLW